MAAPKKPTNVGQIASARQAWKFNSRALEKFSFLGEKSD